MNHKVDTCTYLYNILFVLPQPSSIWIYTNNNGVMKDKKKSNLSTLLINMNTFKHAIKKILFPCSFISCIRPTWLLYMYKYLFPCEFIKDVQYCNILCKANKTQQPVKKICKIVIAPMCGVILHTSTWRYIFFS